MAVEDQSVQVIRGYIASLEQTWDTEVSVSKWTDQKKKRERKQEQQTKTHNKKKEKENTKEKDRKRKEIRGTCID